jgi:hypothetical protein
MQFKLDPIKRCAVFLMFFSAVAFGFNASSQLALHLTATLGFGLVLFALYSTFFPSKHKNVWDTVITGLILFLILHYGSTWIDLVFPLTATFLAITIKFFVEYKGSPIVNPAAAALLLSALLLAFIPGLDHPFVSWWGASYQGMLSLALIAIWVVVGVHAWRRWWAVIAFLVIYALGLLLRGHGLDSVQFVLTDSMVYFYATIMLMEPKTSPFKPGHQVAYGTFAAALTHGLMSVASPYPELFGLVGANIFQTVLRHWPKKGTPVD